jgi:hypothetical protein
MAESSRSVVELKNLRFNFTTPALIVVRACISTFANNNHAPFHTEKGRPGQDRQSRIAITGQTQHDSLNMTAST